MRIIELDGRGWTTSLDFVEALYNGIEQGFPHGWSPDAFIDSMIWRGMGGVEPPYMVAVTNIKDAPGEVKSYVALMITAIREAREDRLRRDGTNIEVSISAPDLSD
jgi:hypothetical protein